MWTREDQPIWSNPHSVPWYLITSSIRLRVRASKDFSKDDEEMLSDLPVSFRNQEIVMLPHGNVGKKRLSGLLYKMKEIREGNNPSGVRHILEHKSETVVEIVFV